MRRWLFILLALVAPLIIVPALPADPPPVAPRRAAKQQKEWKVKGRLYTHSDAVVTADADATMLAQSMSPEQLYYIRYLSIHNVPHDYREDYYNESSFFVNSLAGFGLGRPSRAIIKPAFGGEDNIVVRVNLWDYGISPKLWDSLADKDPYFHQAILRTEVVTRTYGDGTTPFIDKDGKVKEAVETKTTTTPPKKIIAAASWLDTRASMHLGEVLQSTAPIYRADWFLHTVSLEPFYSQFLGIKTLDDFKRLTAFDKRADVTEIKATITDSGSNGMCARVALNNRILARRQTFQGPWWETYDFKTSIGEQSVINNFRNEKRDAGEFIGRLPNGLQVYAITNDKDQLIAAGDTNIVADSKAYDVTVRNGRSCIWCHEAGINPFKSHIQKQVGPHPSQADLGIYQKDPKRALALYEQIRDQFILPNFEQIVAEDNVSFDRAVRAATNNLSAKENGLLFKEIWDRYDNERIDMNQLQFEIGLPEEKIKQLLALRINGQSNGTLIQTLLEPPVSIRRDQFEEQFFELGLLSTLMREGKMPPPVAVPKR